jgi:hypothetical protein
MYSQTYGLTKYKTKYMALQSQTYGLTNTEPNIWHYKAKFIALQNTKNPNIWPYKAKNMVLYIHTNVINTRIHPFSFFLQLLDNKN